MADRDPRRALTSFSISGNSELTPGYELHEYIASPVRMSSDNVMSMGYGLKVTQSIECGQILLISRSIVSCLRQYEIQCRDRELGLSLSGLDSMRLNEAENPIASSSTSSSPGKVQLSSSRVPPEVCEQFRQGIKDWLSDTDFLKLNQLMSLYKGVLDLEREKGFEGYLFQDLELFLHHMTGHPYAVSLAHVEAKNTLLEDRDYLQSIFANNASYDEVRWCEKSEGADDTATNTEGNKGEFWGLWLLPSFINHSCSPNCSRQRVGDYLVIRAARHIKADDELTLPYFDILKPISIRQESCKQWGFRCCCTRCELEGMVHDRYPHFGDIENRLLRMYQQLDTLWQDRVTSVSVANQLLERMSGLCHDIDASIGKVSFTQLLTEVRDATREMEKKAQPGDSEIGLEGGDSGETSSSQNQKQSSGPVTAGSKLSEKTEPELEQTKVSHVQSDKKKESKKKRKAARTKNKDSKIEAEAEAERLFHKSVQMQKEATQLRWLIAQEPIREAFCVAAAEDESLTASHRWGHYRTSPIDKMRESFKLQNHLTDMGANECYAYHIKASFIEAYIASHTIECNKAFDAPSTGRKIVSTVETINALLDVINIIAATAGWNSLAEEFAVALHTHLKDLAPLLPEQALPVIKTIWREGRDFIAFLARASYGGASEALVDFWIGSDTI